MNTATQRLSRIPASLVLKVNIGLGIGFGAVVIPVWLVSDDVGIPDGGSLGSWILILTAVGMGALAVLQGRAFRSE